MIFFNQGILLLGSNHFLIVVSLLSICVVDLIYACFFFFNLLLGLLDESLFMVIEKTRSLFVVYRFYLAYNTSVNFILKLFANSRFQFNLKS